jgi:hypothetical protein
MRDTRPLPYRPLPVMARVHHALGLAGLLMFLGTGLYMDVSLDHLQGMADAPRVLYRSGHIYILLCSLMHLLLGAYVTPRESAPGRGAQYVSTAALAAALALFVYGFWIETPQAQIERPMTRAALELSLAGTLLHCLAALLFPAVNSVRRRPGAAATGRVEATADTRVPSPLGDTGCCAHPAR